MRNRVSRQAERHRLKPAALFDMLYFFLNRQ